MEKIFTENKTKLVLLLILLAALSRLLPHPNNFTPIGAIALFAGCYIQNKRLAFLLPLAIMLFSDLIIEFTTGFGFHPILLWVYASFAVITAIGIFLRGREQRQNIMVASLTGSILFFIITNFGQWATGYYGYTSDALLTSYVNAIPFFRGTIMGDLFYNLVLFGSYSLIKWKYPKLVESRKQ